MRNRGYITPQSMGIIFPPEKELKTEKAFAEYKEATVEYIHHYYLDDDGVTKLTSGYLEHLDLESAKYTYSLFNE